MSTRAIKYPEITFGRVEAVWNKLGGEDGVDRFLRGDLVVSEPTCRFREKDGVIYLAVTSNGMTGPQWIEHLEGKGFRVSDYAKQPLRSKDFRPTTGMTYEIAILKGLLFEENDRVTSKIRAKAESLNLTKPNAEVVCLIRENFSDEEIKAMGLTRIIVMHEPIKDADGYPNLFGAYRLDDGRRLYADYDYPDRRWRDDGGFAFSVPQVGHQV